MRLAPTAEAWLTRCAKPHCRLECSLCGGPVMTFSVALTDRPGQEARVQGSALVRHGAALVRARAYHESWKVPRRRTSGSKALKKGGR